MKSVALMLLLSFFTLKLPELHYNLIRSYVGSKVVKITESSLRSGGTGIHINSPHGNTYILTNAHVCGVGKNGIVYVTSEEGVTIPRRIIESSDFTDLCLVEAMPGYNGLSLGSEPSIGDINAIIGHPRLMPTTVSRGELIGTAEMDVFDHEMTDNVDDKCDLPKNKIIELSSFFGLVKICVIHINAYITNIVILPGNSGSPMINKYGNLVGLAFASDGEAHWGSVITLNDIKEFISPY